MFIGQLARQVGLTPKTVRFYEQRGLLPEPPRSDAGYRLYSSDDVQQLQFVRTAKALGLTLAEIKGILDRWRSNGLPCDFVDRLVRERIAELDQQMETLRNVRERLQAVLADQEVASCRPGGGDSGVVCPRIELARPTG